MSLVSSSKFTALTKWIIIIGTIGVALQLMGFSTFVTQKYIETTNTYIYVLNGPGYFKGINTNIESVVNGFGASDLDLSSHINWSDFVKGLQSIFNMGIWVINLVIILPLKAAGAAISFAASLLGITFKGSALNWLYNFINSILSFNISYLTF